MRKECIVFLYLLFPDSCDFLNEVFETGTQQNLLTNTEIVGGLKKVLGAD